MSSEFSIGAMTPEINLSDAPIIHRKSSKSHFIGPKLYEDQSIPSPPLSPYHSAESSAAGAVQAPVSQTSNNNNNVLKELQQRQLLNSGNEKIDTFVVLSNNKTELGEFPIDKYENYQLNVNAWSNIGSKNFKRAQINFIREYTNRSSSKHNGHISKLTRRYAPRRIIRSVYENGNGNVSSSVGYNSDSDYNSQYEKVRTRRIARESSQALENPSDISRVSTPPPVKRRKPVSSPSVPPMVIDWESIPDYSPDTNLLPNNNRCLKVEWKGQPMSLADDPLLDKLHPAEATLASILRLPCNLFLDSKRRLFAEKVTRMKKGLPFRRTDAQKSCRIDVNKASRLFAAFEKIGWLQDEKFEKFM
ncbi:SWIRM domain-containing protein [Wickerhamomyces ciferrii]|uniref:SWIRM domain-containing protein n=1 Tax=Wickerhamomyces ciferrii (strain ATCC 14091 / BCRC 22168 / CBS 111 / JCM 3599 / NBRC 0793 / NRRL Y-1031 F-60-10) TaxID=1206466 RepID=K0KT45_WICCF|nr:SWIRM domain-containing protein [Wickerhamomyces ciferrii]CCH46316.1 SWIRM domain-containing protein [Wickerhamomyces ciferrii]